MDTQSLPPDNGIIVSGMVDLHCHLLPTMDDGPTTMAEAVEVARLAMNDGITHAIVTPHIHLGRWDNDSVLIAKALDGFRCALNEAGVDLALGMAAEVRLDAEIIPLLSQKKIPFLGVWDGKQVLLLEMPHGHIISGTDKMVEWMLARGVLPMIAHPERNRAIMRNPEKLEPLIALGCLFQITAGSLVGQFGERALSVAQDLVVRGIATILASDAHNASHRPPNLSAGYGAAAALIGKTEAWKLVCNNPSRLFLSNAGISP